MNTSTSNRHKPAGRSNFSTSFRLSTTALAILDRLAADYKRSRTAVLELAIRNLDMEVQEREKNRGIKE